MTTRKKVRISARKEPQQGRSKDLVEAVLQAAIRILQRDGAGAFTMARIAETAGVSVGSLYQYFPNKQAVLFRLQTAEWEQTSAALAAILTDTRQNPQTRLKTMITHFFRSECEEAPFRHALAESAPLYRATPEGTAQRKRAKKIADALMAEILPDATPARRAFAGDFVMTTISALGARISDMPQSERQIDALAQATSEMVWGWLQRQA